MPDADLQPTIVQTMAPLRDSFKSGRTLPLDWRLEQLGRLHDMLIEREGEFLAALDADLGKSRAEGWLSEVGFTLAEIRHARKHLGRWARPRRVRTPLVSQPGRSLIRHEPYGVALVIAPWNYPLQLALGPLAGAIAAGNCAVVKPSELAPHTAAAIAKSLPDYLDTACYTVIEGGVRETTALLAERFDSIFYTGGGRVGRIVMAAAAKHLTPVTLELGGKSPCIVDDRVDMAVAARRIAWGKYLNAGQTCVAPDYVLVHESRKDEFLAALTASMTDMFGADPKASGDYGRIVNQNHFKRLAAFLKNGEIVAGGQKDAKSRYIAPTVLADVPPDAPVMQEEIFGPILPVLTVSSLDEAIAFVNERDKPLALYLFSRSRDSARRVGDRTSSGGYAVNEIALHLANPHLPFGGVGESGMGAYHGRAGFEAFSHRKAVLKRPTILDLSLRYPPYSASKIKWLRRLM